MLDSRRQWIIAIVKKETDRLNNKPNVFQNDAAVYIFSCLAIPEKGHTIEPVARHGDGLREDRSRFSMAVFFAHM